MSAGLAKAESRHRNVTLNVINLDKTVILGTIKMYLPFLGNQNVFKKNTVKAKFVDR